MPDWKREIIQRISGLKLSPMREAEIVEELSSHLDGRYNELLISGVSSDEAARLVLAELQDDQVLARRLQSVERRGDTDPPLLRGKKTGLAADLWKDLRYGFRTLRRNPTVTAIAVVTLALGIGANAAIFSVLNAVLLRPAASRESMVMVWESRPREGVTNNVVSPADFVDWRERQRVFEHIAAAMNTMADITGEPEPQTLGVGMVSTAFFDAFGIKAMLGRTFAAGEDQGNRVVVLSEGLWKRRFAGNSNIVGAAISLNGEAYEVIGIVPDNAERTDLWYPFDFTNEGMRQRANHFLRVFARLKDGVTIERAQQDMDRISREIEAEVPGGNSGHGAHVIDLHEQTVGDFRRPLAVLAAAVGFVLLIACANVANLLLARGALRHRELAIRHALGASRMRIVRQLTLECLWLGLFGAALGLPIAIWGPELLKKIAPANIPGLTETTLDLTVLAYMTGIAMLTALVSGIGPAFQVMGIDPNRSLKETSPTAGGARRRIRHCLIISEIAVAFVLLTGAGLMVRSLVNLVRVEPGFVAENVLTMPIALSRLQLEKRTTPVFFSEMMDSIRSIPGVSSVALTTHVPLSGNDSRSGIRVEGYTPNPNEPTRAHWRIVSPGYFQTMKMRLLEGRFPTEQELTAARVVVINRTAAERYWSGQSPIGKRMQVLGFPDWREVIGVIEDIKHWGLANAVNPEVFMPGGRNPSVLVVRTETDASLVATALRQRIRELDSNLPLAEVRTMDEVIRTSVAPSRFYLLLLATFGALAVLLAGTGIYGVISYTVAQSTREIGVRIAMGARSADVLRSVLRKSLVLTVISLVLGIAASIGLTRLMSSLLFGVTPTDPLTFTAVAAMTMAIALLASYVPARRASRVDPIVALRHH